MARPKNEQSMQNGDISKLYGAILKNDDNTNSTNGRAWYRRKSTEDQDYKHASKHRIPSCEQRLKDNIEELSKIKTKLEG